MTDITGSLQIVSRNEDGTFTVRMVTKEQETALAIPSQGGGFPVRVNGTVVHFASAADFQTAMNALSGGAGSGMPEINTRRGGGAGGGSGLRTAADAAETVNSAIEARNFSARRQDFMELKASISGAREKLASQLSTNPSVIGPLLDLFDATNDAYTLTINTLEEETVRALVDAGIGGTRTISDFMRRRNGYGSGGGDGAGSALLVGGLGLGAGLLLSETLGRHRK